MVHVKSTYPCNISPPPPSLPCTDATTQRLGGGDDKGIRLFDFERAHIIPMQTATMSRQSSCSRLYKLRSVARGAPAVPCVDMRGLHRIDIGRQLLYIRTATP